MNLCIPQHAGIKCVVCVEPPSGVIIFCNTAFTFLFNRLKQCMVPPSGVRMFCNTAFNFIFYKVNQHALLKSSIYVLKPLMRGVEAGSDSKTRLHSLPHRRVLLKTRLRLHQGTANQQADQSQGYDLGREKWEWGAASGRQTDEVIGHRSRQLYCLCPHLARVPGCQGVSGNVEWRDVGR